MPHLLLRRSGPARPREERAFRTTLSIAATAAKRSRFGNEAPALTRRAAPARTLEPQHDDVSEILPSDEPQANTWRARRA